MVKAIPLSRGLVALVDNEDFERVSAHKWTASIQVKGGGAIRRYAFRSIGRRGPRHNVLLHRFILDCPAGLQVDHVNGDGLDCRRANLRFATNQQNNANRSKNPTHHPFKGVRPGRWGKGWTARITVNNRGIHLGTFETAEEAARAYDAKAVECFGEFARLNFSQRHG